MGSSCLAGGVYSVLWMFYHLLSPALALLITFPYFAKLWFQTHLSSMTSTPPPPRPFTDARGSADENETAAVGYGAVAVAHAALAIPMILKPQSVAEYMLGGAAVPGNVEQDHLFGLLAAGLLSGASAAWALKGCAERRDLDSPTAERLELGLMAMAGTALGVHLVHGKDLTANGLGAGAAAAALTLGVPAAGMMTTAPGRRRLGSRIARFFDAAGRLFNFRRGFKLSTALYAAITPLFFGAGIAYVIAPGWTLSNIMGYALKGRDATFVWRNVGSALLSVLPAITYSLKEKADSDELTEATPRILNAGLMLTSVGHLAVLGPMVNDGVGGRYLPGAVGVWAASAVAALVGLSSSASDKRF